MRRNGSNLEQAMALLIQNQAAFMSLLAETHKRQREAETETHKWQREADVRFARIERDLEQIKAILVALPEAIRQKIGFKSR